MTRSSLEGASTFLAAVLVLGCTGCRAVGDYFADRAGDLSDAIQLGIGGPAAGAHVDATVLASTGLDVWKAYGDGGTVGNFTRRVPGAEPFAAYSVILFHARGVDPDPAARDPDDAADFPPVHAGFLTHVHELGRPFEDGPPPENLRPLRWLDVEVSAAAVLGVRARVSPGELLDFLLGWFGLDLGGDDGAGRETPDEETLDSGP